MTQILRSFIISVIISAYSGINAQLVFEENFPYEPGILTQVSGQWIENPAGTGDVEVLAGNLSYPEYASSGQGNYILLDCAAAGRSGIQRALGMTLNTVYISFLLSVRDTLDLLEYSTTGTIIFDYLSSYNESRGILFIKKSSSTGNVNLGICKTGSIPAYLSRDIPIGETTLIVMRYRLAAGSYNDTLSIWINPPLAESEPQPDMIAFSGADPANISFIRFRQGSNGGNIYIDGIRVSSSWGNAPLPVQLSSFSAVNKGDRIILNWKTETELANYGFDIERKISSNYINEDWRRVGFREGYGNSNSPRYYSFTDDEVYNFCSYSYRLRQINTDGTFIYYDPVEVNISIPGKFNLYQNYPNPFNPVTTIKFSVPEDAYSNIILYSITGEKKSDIYNKYTAAGDYKVEFNAEGISNGVYLCVLESGGKRKTIKMIIAK